MKYAVSEEEWKRKCVAVGQHPSSVPHTLTDILIEKILRKRLTERIEFPDRQMAGLYLRAEADYAQKDGTTAPGARTWRLGLRISGVPGKAGRCHYAIGNARQGMSLDAARAKAAQDWAVAREGHDPQARAEQEAAKLQTVRAYLETVYFPQILAPFKTGNEIHNYMRKVWAGVLDKPLASLTRGDVEGGLTAWKARGVKGATLSKVWHHLAAMIRHASAGEVIPADFAARLTARPGALHRAKGGEHVHWLGRKDPDEVRRFAEALAAFETSEPGGGEFLRTIVCVALTTGMRTGEILGLSDASLDLRGKTAFLRADETKGNKDHTVDLPDAAVAALARWAKVRNSLAIGHGGALFPKLPGKPPDHWERRLTASTRDFHKVRRAAGIEGRCSCCNRVLHPHDLRHSHAVAFLKAGGSMGALQKQLGHTDITTTQRHYGHIVESDLRKLVLSMPYILAR